MIGTLIQNRYRVDAELGQGGMGAVYRAHDMLLDRDAAIKVLNNTGLGTEGRARLLREARAIARLNHPNIVTVYDAGEMGDTPFIVMELVAGETLRHIPTPTLDDALAYARQICAALAHAHAQGIVHRDLKPENVILARSPHPPLPGLGEGAQGVRVKLMDFGLAWSENAPRLTQEGALLGTFAYLAPELITGGPASPQSDLYALGVMLYELLTGRPPFEGNDLMLVLGQHLHAPITPPCRHNPTIPPEVNALVVRLLSKAPEDRPASAGEVFTALGGTELNIVTGLAARSKHNLPTQLSTFIGREKEIAQVKQKLTGHRLVTLTGSGGVGKTRLAIQVGREVQPLYSNGVWLIELAPLAKPELVTGAVAFVLDVHDSPERPVLDALTDYLREKSALLVLDNCEHLIDACAQLAEHLLQHCPQVQILASSREALGIEGETAVRVPSLTLPPTERASRETLEQSEAVRLFVERATAALPGFALTEANAPAIVQVCRRLDGVPLAIELAAARVKLLKVEQIAARLDDAFRLLTGGSRTALPRQQTLRATIDWSYNLLAEAERTLLQRLSVFAGGWTLEAAEAVCAGEDMLDALMRLTNKSMVIADRELGHEARYRLLETIRQYAREKLAESGESEQVRHRHLDFFLRLAEQAKPELRGPRQVEWLDRLDAEHDNLLAALEWALANQVERGLVLVVALVQFWLRRDYLREAREWLEAAVARTKTTGRTLARARAINGAAQIAFYLGNLGSAHAHLEESLAISQELGDTHCLAESLNWKGMEAWQQSDYPIARVHLQESLALFEQLGDNWNIANTLHFLGHVDMDQNQHEAARTHFEASLRLFRDARQGDVWLSITLIKDLGLLAYLRNDYVAARRYFEESLQLARQLESREIMAEDFNALGDLARCRNDYVQAEVLYNESLAFWNEIGTKTKTSSTLCNLACVALHQGDHQKAAALFSASLTVFREQDDKKGTAECLAGLAGVMSARGEARRAATLLGAAQAARETLGVTLWPANQIEHDHYVAVIRTQLNEAAVEATWAQGRAMTIQQAIAYALEEVGP